MELAVCGEWDANGNAFPAVCGFFRPKAKISGKPLDFFGPF
jgi:hypothetical protein